VAYSTQFERVVKRVMGDLSYRSVAKEMGVTHSYVGEMYSGRIPSRDVVIKLAEVLKANADELLIAAGYAPLSARWDADLSFMAGIRRLAEQVGEPIMVSTEELPLADASEADVQRALDAIRKRIGKPVDEPHRAPRRGRPRKSGPVG